MKKNVILTMIICTFVVSGLYLLNAYTREITKITIEGSYPAYDLDDLTTKADLIIQAVAVERLPAKWNNEANKKPDKITGNDMIVQDTRFSISNILKGKPSTNSVTVRVFGGKVKNARQEFDEAKFLSEIDSFIIPHLHKAFLYLHQHPCP